MKEAAQAGSSAPRSRAIAPGQWLWVRPGRTQCRHPSGSGRGPFTLFERVALQSHTARLLAHVTTHDAPAVLTPHPDDALWAERTALQLLGGHRALGPRPSTCITPCAAANFGRFIRDRTGLTVAACAVREEHQKVRSGPSGRCSSACP